MADAGTLWLLLTGGEPLLRADFQDIYLYAKHKGFLITLFTNGTLLTNHIADLLADYPPFTTEITLYGATQKTYEKVTGIKGSFTRCMTGIELLVKRNIPLKLKAMAMTLTLDEIPEMKAFAESLGVNFRYDPILNNDIDGNHSPFPLRLTAKQVGELEQSDPTRMQDWLDFYQQQSQINRNNTYWYSCGAGTNAFHIDPFGHLSLCMSARSPSYDLRNGSFQNGWDEFLLQVRHTPAPKENECGQCNLHPLCGQCPGWTQSENGIPGKPVEYLCQIAHRRAQLLGI